MCWWVWDGLDMVEVDWIGDMVVGGDDMMFLSSVLETTFSSSIYSLYFICSQIFLVLTKLCVFFLGSWFIIYLVYISYSIFLHSSFKSCPCVHGYVER